MTTLPVRTIGSLRVGVLGLGCMGMSAVYGVPDRAAARATVDRAIERGVTLFDTADMYSSGDNERFVGSALGRRRDQVVLATKVGITSLPLVGLPTGLNGHPDYIRRSIDASLRRLGSDHVDLYYLHRVDPRVPIEDSVGAMSGLVTAGKVRELGVSEVTGDELRRAHAVHPIAAVQSEWSLFTRDIEVDLVPAARALGVTIVPYRPLGTGNAHRKRPGDDQASVVRLPAVPAAMAQSQPRGQPASRRPGRERGPNGRRDTRPGGPGLVAGSR